MNRARYRDHAIPPRSDVRTSLERHLPRQRVSEGTLRKLVAEAREAGVRVFLESDLARMPWASREIIETEHKRLCERR